MGDAAAGVAVTISFLRLMVCLCLKYDNYRSGHTCRTTRPKQYIAIKHIGMKKLFEPHNISYASKDNEIHIWLYDAGAKGRATEDKWPKIYLANNTRNLPYHWHYCQDTRWLYITIEMMFYR
jgi:hypothetical protein